MTVEEVIFGMTREEMEKHFAAAAERAKERAERPFDVDPADGLVTIDCPKCGGKDKACPRCGGIGIVRKPAQEDK